MLNKHDLWDVIIKQLYFCLPLSQLKSILGLSVRPLTSMVVIRYEKVYVFFMLTIFLT